MNSHLTSNMKFSLKSIVNILALSAFVSASPVSFDQDLVVRDISQSQIDMLVKRAALPKKKKGKKGKKSKKGKKAKKVKAKRDDTPEDADESVSESLESADGQSLLADSTETDEDVLTKRSAQPKKKKNKKKKGKKAKAKRDEDE
ncbi:hypothetical protein HDV01_001656 [Terramyces sp. JEL0728]|nr:hypothetical protein HDV01_001656 [Terramyces sp. JEL0728]